MKIGYVQTSPCFGKKEKNFRQVEKLLNNFTADMIVLPELFATGYTFTSKAEAEKTAENKHGPTAEFLKNMSASTGAVIVGGFVEKEAGSIYNSALMVSSNGVVDTYRKIHLFNKEKLWFSSGDKDLKVYEINGVKIGMMICFDWIFPETARTLALLGADIIAHPANLVMPYCQAAMVTRCLENRVFAVISNRVGTEKRGEDNFTFTGGSRIISCNGDVLSSAPADTEFAYVTEIDHTLARNKRINPYNDLFKDRRPGYYK